MEPAKTEPPIPEEELTLLGSYYDNLATWTVVADARCFRILPHPIGPRVLGGIVFVNLLILGFFGSVIYLLARNDATPFAFLAVSVIGVGTCLGFSLIAITRFRREIARGPYLEYDRVEGRLHLPRLKRSFTREEVVRVQQVVRVPENYVDYHSVSELQVVTESGHETQRWLVLTSLMSVRAFPSVIAGLQEHTDLPIVSVNESFGRLRVEQVSPTLSRSGCSTA